MKTSPLTSLSVIVLAAGMMGCEGRNANADSSQTNSLTTTTTSKKSQANKAVASEDVEAKQALATLVEKTTKDCGSYKLLRTTWTMASSTYAYREVPEIPNFIITLPLSEADRMNGIEWKAVASIPARVYSKLDLRGEIIQWMQNGDGTDPMPASRVDVVKRHGKVTFNGSDASALQSPSVPCKEMPK
jgi:hypothetical protein